MHMLAFAAAVPTASLLAGTSWSVALDIGAERGSWMPPTWGRSGARCTPTVRVSLEEGERVLLRETGYFDRTKWEPEGAYELDGGTLRFWLEHKGIEKDDTILEPGKLYFAAPHFAGTQLLGKKGMLTIRQKKLGFLPFIPTFNEGSFIVGTCRVEAWEPPADDPAAGRTEVE